MARYIDAELLESKYREGTDPQDPYSEITYLLPEDVESIPTADVELVRHGRWVERNGSYGFTFYCSECGEVAHLDKFEERILSDFCPSCGAKMDGDADA